MKTTRNTHTRAFVLFVCSAIFCFVVVCVCFFLSLRPLWLLACLLFDLLVGFVFRDLMLRSRRTFFFVCFVIVMRHKQRRAKAKKAFSSRGAYIGFHHLQFSLPVRLSVRCNKHDGIFNCESCTWPISTNSGSTKREVLG